MFFSNFPFLALVAVAHAVPAPQPHVLHEKRETPFVGKRSRVDGDAIIPLRVGVKQSNLEHGYDWLMDVSSTFSSNYGKHWTAEQVNEKFSPSTESIRAITEWLQASGIHIDNIHGSANKGWLAVDIPARHAEKLLRTEYFEQERSDETHLGCDEYSLPIEIAKHVDYIRPGVTPSPPMRKRSLSLSGLLPDVLGNSSSGSTKKPGLSTPAWGRPGRLQNPWDRGHWSMPPDAYNLPPDLQTCARNITPACIRALYDIPIADPADSTPENAVGVYEDQFDEYSQRDINLFFAKYAPNVPPGTHPVLDSINGGKAPTSENSTKNGGESDLDLDVLYSLLYPQTVILYQTKEQTDPGASEKYDMKEYTFLSRFLDAIDGSFCTALDRKSGVQCGIYNLTRVVSISYSAPELVYSEHAVRRACNEIMKLSLQGHTFVTDSGDYGVASHPEVKGSNGCINRAEPHEQGLVGTVFNPQFPATCPYVLGVGGTMLDPGQTIDDPETALDDPPNGPEVPPGTTFSSSGGFSNYEPRPSYQNAAVEEYLTAHNPGYPSYDYTNIGSIEHSNGLYNRAGRGFPDVSANGAYFMIYFHGVDQPFFGTSISTPIWASIITLINENRTAQGKGPVGFVNPALYENPHALHDITNGTNPGCGTRGFPAAPGWDPITGLGTPNYPALLELFSWLQ